ncbi:chain acyl-CoA synthetase 9, chloroplastic [Seminavis robusta]|uniref:Chain acyl-CoA synthetase 9, chloroplastic n=1 Tax=Seminavis robusta TaxID=568900 RepID=A0A9N8DQ77_9STRA|nr:chain acyl-CoA synthetase 9, chloroplastic [Seminavis robusta]|eukprot:Sro274_g105370.1 chain acyl-CoA synthetase 9, chloroplastic (721) ;mRNA; r:27140-29667
MSSPLFIPLKFFLIALDFFITIITFGWLGIIQRATADPGLRTVPVGDDESHRVQPAYKNNLTTTPVPGAGTLYDLAKMGFEKYADKKCMGYREFVGWKTPKVKEFGDTYWKTFGEVGIVSAKFGAALRGAGLEAAPPTTNLEQVTTKSRLAIFENTCPEWMIAALGAFGQSITVATIYATLGMDAVEHAVNDNIISVIVCNKRNVEALIKRKDNMPTLKTIVYTNDLIAKSETVDLPATPDGMTIVSFEDFCAGGDTEKFPPTPPEPDTTAVIMYTSGSTGKPKGVVITHRCIVGACAAGDIELGIRKGEDVYLGYLPLAHIMELMAEFVMVSQGVLICYADPKSLSATGAFPTGALEHFAPTIMVAVPKIWDTIKKGLQAKVAASPPVAQFLVNTAFEAKTYADTYGYDTPLFNALVFKKFKKAIGGNLRFAISGGGPLNGEVQDFIRRAFGFPLCQGYGLTETVAGLTFQARDDFRHGIAGVCIPSAEAKLVSTPDICDKAGQPYLSTDRTDVEGEKVWGRGEICTKGVNVSSGYYMNEEATKEAFDDDGWFHTGDIGQFMADGSIKIVDRKKNLVKLKGGEYIALEKMEMVFGNSDFVDAVGGGICVYGDGDMDRPVALMQLKMEHTMIWAKKNGIEGDFETLLKDPKVYEAVMKDMKEQHAKSDLSHLEKLVAVQLLNSPWTPENGCLTAANKLQRKAVIQSFENEFNDLKPKGIF